jgi:hypothetical protein
MPPGLALLATRRLAYGFAQARCQTLATIEAGLVTPWVRRLRDRWGHRHLGQGCRRGAVSQLPHLDVQPDSRRSDERLGREPASLSAARAIGWHTGALDRVAVVERCRSCLTLTFSVAPDAGTKGLVVGRVSTTRSSGDPLGHKPFGQGCRRGAVSQLPHLDVQRGSRRWDEWLDRGPASLSAARAIAWHTGPLDGESSRNTSPFRRRDAAVSDGAPVHDRHFIVLDGPLSTARCVSRFRSWTIWRL